MNISQLPLRNGESLYLQGESTGSCADLGILDRLLSLDPGDLPSGIVPEVILRQMVPPTDPGEMYPLVRGKRLHVFFDRVTTSVQMYVLQDISREDLLNYCTLLRYTLAYGVLAGILRGKPVTLVHCSLLETHAGAVMICGESGVGKSTTARRWCAAGGICYGDDMILLESREDGFYCHPLPTWSACSVSLDGKYYPFSPGRRLVGVLGLSRGKEREEIKPLLAHEFFAQIYRALYYFQYACIQYFPLEQQKYLTAHLQQLTERLTAEFPARGLFAHLDGDIRSTLKDYL